MVHDSFVLKKTTENLPSGSVTWQSPSNIALIKYWGKYGEQLPKNPSISFTLNNCNTKTQLSFEPKKTKGFSFDVFFEGKKEESFKPKIEKFFQRIQEYLPFLEDYHFTIETSNSFPHSSGIASSASGMSALALCLMSIENEIAEVKKEYFYEKASFLARLGSGSAARSLYGDLVVWGEHPETENSSNLFGSAYPYQVHEVFKSYQDTILLVDKGEKTVSSTVGHQLMHDHPFAENRFRQAFQNMEKIQSILAEGNLDDFIALVESEALTLHAMMMASNPYFILMKPNTLNIINKIWEYRKETGSMACFTLDAGANVHLLYPEKEKESVQNYIGEELSKFCQNKEFINDCVGNGPKKL